VAGTGRMIRKALPVACAAVAIAYLATCGLLYLSQRSYLYYPAPRRGDAPAFVLHRGDADVVVSTNGVEGADAVLYFGGNAEDVSQAIAPLARAFPGRAVFAMHYRSYGGSTGTPSERALVADAMRLFEVVAKGHPRIVVIGRSLGSGVAIQVAAAYRIERLVLVTPYNGIAELAAARFRWFPVRLLLRDRYESWRHAPRVRAPTTLVVAGRDQVIPNDSSLRLAARFAPGTAHVVRFADAGHNDVSEFPGYFEALAGRHPNGD